MSLASGLPQSLFDKLRGFSFNGSSKKTWSPNSTSGASTLAPEPKLSYDSNDWLLSAEDEKRVRANLAALKANADATLAQVNAAEQTVEIGLRKIRRTNHWPDQYCASDVKIMNAQLLSAYRQLDIARTQQDGIEACMMTARNIIHPLRKTPFEVLQLVFESLFHEVEHTDLVNVLTFLLSVVCRRWRHVAQNTPTLWTRVKIDVKPGAESWLTDCAGTWERFAAAKRYDERVKERATYQLQLACPTRDISLKLVFHDNACICTRRSGNKRILPIVRQAIARAETINVVTTDSTLRSGPCQCITRLFGVEAIPGKLAKFTFSSKSNQHQLFYIPASSFFFTAIDSVRCLEFYGTFPKLKSRQVFIGVTVINFHLPKVTLRLASLGSVLAGTPNAEVLILNCRVLGAAPGPLPTVIRHEKLKSLTIKARRMHDVSVVHVIFLLPQLRQLELDFRHGGGAPIHAVHADEKIKLVSFLISGSSVLDVVVLRGMDASAPLADAITAPEFPRISKLVLEEGLLSGEFWARLETRLTTVSPACTLAKVECYDMVSMELQAVQQLVAFLDMQGRDRKVWTTNGILADSAPSVKIRFNPPLIYISKYHYIDHGAMKIRKTRRLRASKQIQMEVAMQLEERLRKQWELVADLTRVCFLNPAGFHRCRLDLLLLPIDSLT